MNEKHTPGPWAIVDRDDSLVIQTESPAKTKYGASRYACLGGFDRHDDKQYAEAKANARDYNDGFNTSWLAKRVRAAIAKATVGAA